MDHVDEGCQSIVCMSHLHCWKHQSLSNEDISVHRIRHQLVWSIQNRLASIQVAAKSKKGMSQKNKQWIDVGQMKSLTSLPPRSMNVSPTLCAMICSNAVWPLLSEQFMQLLNGCGFACRTFAATCKLAGAALRTPQSGLSLRVALKLCLRVA